MLARSVADVEAALAALVGAVPVTAYAAGEAAPAWAESPGPLTAARPDGALLTHLRYSVSVEVAQADAGGGGVDPSGRAHVLADVAVVYLYRLRARLEDRMDDARDAARLAADVVRGMLRPATIPAGAEVARGVTLVPTTIYRPGREAGGFLPIEIRFSAAFDLSL